MNKNTSTYQYYSALHLLQLSKIPVPGTELNVQKQCAFDICIGAAYSDGILTGICCLAIHASIVKKNTNTYHHAMETHSGVFKGGGTWRWPPPFGLNAKIF